MKGGMEEGMDGGRRVLNEEGSCILSLFSYFSSCCDKTQDESNFKEKGFIRLQSILAENMEQLITLYPKSGGREKLMPVLS